ncbi:unnamed protein product, partial [Didymodactylos carnosus]
MGGTIPVPGPKRFLAGIGPSPDRLAP